MKRILFYAFFYVILPLSGINHSANAQLRKDGFVLSYDGTFLEKYVGKESYVILPTSVTDIAAGAFWECKSLKFIAIPPAVETIGHSAFFNCKNLKTVCVSWSTPLKLDYNPFRNLNLGKMKLEVPRGTRSRYALAPVWKEFGEMVEYNLF
ncbi:MAG: leucine-rich repeat domain-containing protein [Tannerella sp.]|jgi:hypothetical protein|nr:leucine-rich repeat domain-containing protein [Tannerella sp.]